MKQYSITRKQYKDMKKMDHSQFDSFCRSLYSNGYQDGQKDAQSATVEIPMDYIKEALIKIKGIGEKKADDIIGVLRDVKSSYQGEVVID